ncbi:hypothetical protein NT6N_40200 [Oceaniferula spumae]|uniref:Uncharacterized protein n=1 Tax=Oceaniferula spumae TaxID=2979115 RepID=A0AAT9FSJ6_9BACT
MGLISLILTPLLLAEELKIHTYKRTSPWGQTVHQYSYYLKDGVQIQHGDELMFSDDGNLDLKISYQHDEPHGLTSTYYKRIQQKASESTYVRGDLHGPERQWSAEGKLLFECEWKNGDPWNGRAASKSASGTGTIESSESWTTYLYKNGKKVPNSEKVFTSKYRHQIPSQRPNINAYLRWNWRSYLTKSKYPHVDQLPSYAKVPFLIDWCAKRGDSAGIAHSQLVALTRVDWGATNSSEKKSREAEVLAWKQWWQNTGQHRRQLRETKGKRDPEAWKLVAGKRALKMPATSIVIPEEYELQLTYSSGDYGSVIDETITLKRTKNDASLVRVYSTLRDGPKTTQTWLPFSIEEADQITRAIGYLIDHPWLGNDEEAINRRFWEEQKKTAEKPTSSVKVQKIKGRESFHIYYANATLTLKDKQGNVWWNDDPSHWHGGNEERYNHAAEPLSSTVYPFVVSRYPENTQWTEKDPHGWQKVEK